MAGFLKRLRGIIGNGVVWATGWAVGAVVLTLLVPLALGFPSGAGILGGILKAAGVFGGLGFLCGSAFSVYLGVVGRNKRLKDLGPLRYALRGAVASGVILPILAFALPGSGDFHFWVRTFGMAGITIVLGGLSAFATVKLAQRSDRILTEASLEKLEEEQDEVRSLIGGGSE